MQQSDTIAMTCRLALGFPTALCPRAGADHVAQRQTCPRLSPAPPIFSGCQAVKIVVVGDTGVGKTHLSVHPVTQTTSGCARYNLPGNKHLLDLLLGSQHGSLRGRHVLLDA